MSAERRMRVLFLVPHVGTGGAEVALRHILEALPAGQFDATLLCAPGQPLADVAQAHGMRVVLHTFPTLAPTSHEAQGQRTAKPVAVARFGLAAVRLAGWLMRHLRGQPVDVIYTGNTLAHLVAALACALTGTRLVWHVQEIMDARLLGGLGRHVFGLVGRMARAHVVVPSGAIASAQLWARRLTLVPHGVDVGRRSVVAPAPLRAEYQLPAEVPLVGLVGRVVGWKGHALFLAAAAQLDSEGHRASWLIVGSAMFGREGFVAELRAQAARQGMADNVVFTGFRSDIPAVMRALDVVVVPSLRPEPFGLVALEAMAAGTPVVAADGGGLPEIVVNGQTGVLFPMRDAAALADALRPLLADTNLRARYGEAGVQRAAQHFPLQAYTTRMAALLADAAQR